MGELKWYVLRAVAGQEKKAKAYIETELSRQGFDDYVPQVVIPSERVYEIRNGKKRVREKTLFPGYLYVQADTEHGEAMHTLTDTPGVIGFLGADASSKNKNQDPVPLREAEVNRILGNVEQSDEMEEELETPFIPGETITVMDGPFKGFNGTVEEVFEDKKKLNVVVKIFGRNTPLELNFSQVEKTA